MKSQKKTTPYFQSSGELNAVLTLRLSRLQAHLNRQAARVLAHYGLSISRWRILYLINIDGAMSASDIHDTLGSDKGLLSRTLKAMQEEGLVAIDVQADISRKRMISITDKGLAQFESALPAMRQRYEQIYACFNQEEARQFLDFIERLDDIALKEIELEAEHEPS